MSKINYAALLSALLLSSIAAYYSVIGLATIFSGAFISVLIMGSVLELTKVVTVGWLTTNWNKASTAIKTYLCTSVFILMLITSMGTFGYLSKAHLAQSAQVNQSQFQIQPLEYQLKLEESRLRNAQTSLDTLDKFANSSINQNDGIYIRSRQVNERKRINLEIDDATRKLQNINTQLLPLRTSQQVAQAEVGPLKYIAELIYGSNADVHFDESVRLIIMIIVIVFDPLAIVLLLAANISLGKIGSINTKLWVISRSPKDKKTGFRSAIVSADTEEEAKSIYPGGNHYMFMEDAWYRYNEELEELIPDLQELWINPIEVRAKFIGETSNPKGNIFIKN